MNNVFNIYDVNNKDSKRLTSYMLNATLTCASKIQQQNDSACHH